MNTRTNSYVKPSTEVWRVRFLRLFTALVAAAIGGCALTTPQYPDQVYPAIERLPSEPPVSSVSSQPSPKPVPPIPAAPARKPVPSIPVALAPALIPDRTPPLSPVVPAPPPYPDAQTGRSIVIRLLPPKLSDRSGWATDIYVAFAMMEIPLVSENICAAIAVTEQESLFQADPTVPGLSKIAWGEIDKRRARYGIPQWALDAALTLRSSDGRSYKTRIDQARTERELSETFEDLITMVPFGQTLLAKHNPVRTGGPMQVSIEFAEQHATVRPYPYPIDNNIRNEVFTRHGGLYFGIAHLLDYPAPYNKLIYRFADFNAGHYACRNAAFQNAVGALSGIRLTLDGDLLRYENGKPAEKPGATQAALEAMGGRLRMGREEIRRALLLEKSAGFQQTALYREVFALAENATGHALPRAVIPDINLKGPKIQRKLTTGWFSNRVTWRYEKCIARSRSARVRDVSPHRSSNR